MRRVRRASARLGVCIWGLWESSCAGIASELHALQGREALTGHAEAEDSAVFLEQLLEQSALPCPRWPAQHYWPRSCHACERRDITDMRGVAFTGTLAFCSIGSSAVKASSIGQHLIYHEHSSQHQSIGKKVNIGRKADRIPTFSLTHTQQDVHRPSGPEPDNAAHWSHPTEAALQNLSSHCCLGFDSLKWHCPLGSQV